MDRDLFLVVFLSLSLSIFFVYLPNFTFLLPYEAALAFMFLLAIAIIFNIERAFAALAVLSCFSLLQGFLPYVSSAELQLAIFFLGLAFVHQDLYKIFTEHANTLKKLAISALHGVGLFLAATLSILLLSLLMLALGVHSDSANVYSRLSDLPLYILLFAVFFAPIGEEVFFRGFLANRYGVLVSSVIFSLSHVFYNSTSELAGAFLIGLIFSYYFVKTRNLAACMVAHGLFNAMSISLMLLQKQLGA